jgi:hypothetical protein
VPQRRGDAGLAHLGAGRAGGRDHRPARAVLDADGALYEAAGMGAGATDHVVRRGIDGDVAIVLWPRPGRRWTLTEPTFLTGP